MKNHANNLAMLLMALAIAFTFFACEEKEKKAEAAVEASEAEYDPVAECPSKTSLLETADATFLETSETLYCMAIFRLADGNELVLKSDKEQVKNLKKGDKVSVTYTDRQEFTDGDCWNHKALESVKKLPK